MPALFGLLFLIVFYSWFNPAAAEPASLRSMSIERDIPSRIEIIEPQIKAITSAAFDQESGLRLQAQNAEDVRSIASLTKLMSALVFLEHNPGWEEIVTMQASDRRIGGRDNFFAGDRLTVEDLFTAALAASDNTAVAALVRAAGFEEGAFVAAMNEKAVQLRMRNTFFADPTGLAPENRSTAADLAKLAETAFAMPEIVEALQIQSTEIAVAPGVERRIESTNDLLGKDLPASARLIAAKTGHLDEAGYCFVALFERDGRRIITVVLGAEGETERFFETTKLLDWTGRAYQWN